ncbi:hypothetical protein LINGRAHAP2_LOCUS14666 [Linum grandiflorum]
MDLATSEELVGAVQDWPRSRYSDTEIESCRTTVWRYLVGECEPYTASTTLSHCITIPFDWFLHIIFNGTISVGTGGLVQNFDCTIVYAGMLRPMSYGYIGSRALARNYVPSKVELRSCLPYSRAKELADGLRCSEIRMPEMTGAERRMMAELGFMHILEPTNVTVDVDTTEIDRCISRIERHIREIVDILNKRR